MATKHISCHEEVEIQGLLKSALQNVVKTLPYQESRLHILPNNVKDNLLQLMCKRGKVTDENIVAVLTNKQRTLELRECEISDSSLELIASKCPQLRKLDLNAPKDPRTSISSRGICAIAQNCKYLQIVYLRRCINITDEAAIALAQNCPFLRDLNLGGCSNITDASLSAIGVTLRNLRSIEFSRTAVTDNGVHSLVSDVCANSLEEIHMAGCEHLTDEAVEAVTNYCPNIKILIFHGCPSITERSRIALDELNSHQVRMKQVTWTIY